MARIAETDGLTPALRAKVDEIRSHLARGTARDAADRYQIGAAVRQIEADPRKYGRSAVARAAQALGLSEDVLYEAAAVARAWREKDFRAVAARRNRFGVPLSFSHFIEIAAVRDADARDALVKEALEQGLSVRELAHRIGARESTKRSGGFRFLRAIVSTAKSLTARRESWRAHLEKIDELEPTAELTKRLEAAALAQRQLAEDFAADARLTEAALRRARRK